jgi:hypothetical protein
VTLTPTLVLPAGGHNPALSGSFGTYTGGAATGSAFSWPEVGIITLTPAVASYLSSGALTGTASGNVGRFIPNGFTTALNTPVFGTACAAGSFGYVGQPFTYTVAPVITATAVAVDGTTTQNYTGSLMRLTNASLTGRTYTPTPSSPALTLSGLPATSSDPAVADLGTGQSTLTFSAGSTQGFTTNISDVCTAAPAIAFSAYLLNLQAGKTCVRDSGSPGVSGQGCAAVATSRYSSAASVGAFNLILAAPGAGNSGAVWSRRPPRPGSNTCGIPARVPIRAPPAWPPSACFPDLRPESINAKCIDPGRGHRTPSGHSKMRRIRLRNGSNAETTCVAGSARPSRLKRLSIVFRHFAAWLPQERIK